MEAAKSIGVGPEEWVLAHEALPKLRLQRAGLDAEEGKWMLRAFRAATHLRFAYASFAEYIERLFGLGRRTTEEKLRVAEALEQLPELEQALCSGALNWSAVRELSRVAVAETEREWIAAARGNTVREVERLVSGLARGDRPKDPRRSELVRHVLRFEVGSETLAAFREAMRWMQKGSEHRLDDDAALLSMAREILGGPRDSGRASYQIVVTQCEDCGRGFQHANGEAIPLDPAIVEMCRCDAQQITIPPVARRRENQSTSAHVDAVYAEAVSDANVDALCAEAVCAAHVDAVGAETVSAAHVDAVGAEAVCAAHVDAVGAETVSAAHVDAVGAETVCDAHVDAVGAATVCDAHVDAVGAATVCDAHVDAVGAETVCDATAGRRERVKGVRATQDTPPAARREVFLRDRGRCVVPGCRNATYLDVHHLDLRSEGGGNEPDNLVVLCGAHHGALHRGHLRIDGRVSTGLRVRHADGTTYGFMPSPMLAEASVKVFAALKNLSYPERIARSALERTLASAPANASAETLLRSALAHAARC